MKLSNLEESLLRDKFPNENDYDNALSRLENGEPFAYVIGEWYFYDETYKVSPDCLIPRPETEHLVEWLIKNLPINGTFADLCTGSGCIAISTLTHRKDLTAVAVDISEKALEIAKDNAQSIGVCDRISFVNGDILKAFPLEESKFDAIVSNPPYIQTDVIETLSVQVKNEPRIALDGGNDGLDFYRVIFGEYVSNVKPGGVIICEIGYDQGEALKTLFGCEIMKDYSGNDRIALLKIN
jgi:release factor glutamine methyltransferase